MADTIIVRDAELHSTVSTHLAELRVHLSKPTPKPSYPISEKAARAHRRAEEGRLARLSYLTTRTLIAASVKLALALPHAELLKLMGQEYKQLGRPPREG
jgi:hypothetical protein